MVDSNAMRKTFVVPDVEPLDQYDSNRAKICASVGWLLAKSYGNAGTDPLTHTHTRNALKLQDHTKCSLHMLPCVEVRAH